MISKLFAPTLILALFCAVGLAHAKGRVDVSSAGGKDALIGGGMGGPLDEDPITDYSSER